MPTVAGNGASERLSALRWAFALLLAAWVGVMAWRVAWVSEDAFITFRYVSNALAGFGPVFNVGESVQGYTHPLWFLLLLAGNHVVSDLVPLSIGLGIALAAASQLLMTHTLCRLGGASWHGGLAAALGALLWVSSPAWIEFSTSGLENSLTHLLVVGLVSELMLRKLERPFVVTVLVALLVLNRPDHAVFCLPVALLLLPQLRKPGGAASVALGALPLVAWIAFAVWYYGDLVPNTAYAKVGIFRHWYGAAAQGFVYVWDWVRHEPVPALSALGLLAFATLRAADAPTRALATGTWMHLVYVVWVAGDFMRGRFLLLVLVAGTALGLATLVMELRRRQASPRWPGAALAAAALAFVLTPDPVPPPGPDLPASGIVDERLVYPGYHWDAYRRAGGVLDNRYVRISLATELREYAEACGSVTIHTRNPGTIGYLAGPQVQVIDLLGLTDATIARLPKKALVSKAPRVGHPYKRIPLAYLAARGDISFLEGWENALEEKDCSFRSRPAAYLGSSLSLTRERLFPLPRVE